MRTLDQFYDFCPTYVVRYMGENFEIDDMKLGDLARESHSSEAILTHHMGGMGVHQIKGIVGEMVRHYAQLVADQKKVRDEAKDAAYRAMKKYTLGQLMKNSRRTPATNSSVPTDRLVASFLSSRKYDDLPFGRIEVQHLHEVEDGLRLLEETLGRLENSQTIIQDTYKTAISLNANERSDRSNGYMANAT